MKNVFVIFLMGFSLTIMAQHVTPLDIKIAELNLDSLRGAYLAQPTMYRASLDVVAEQLEVELKYEGYIRREQAQIEEMRRLESRLLSPDTPYDTIHGLRKEAQEKLSRVRPRSIGQAARISGVSPADVAALMIYLEK